MIIDYHVAAIQKSQFFVFVPGLELECTRDSDIRVLYEINSDFFSLLVLTLSLWMEFRRTIVKTSKRKEWKSFFFIWLTDSPNCILFLELYRLIDVHTCLLICVWCD